MAGEAQTYDGPWDVPDHLRKLNGVLRYSQGTATDGFSITAMAYWAKWNATNQIPERAVAEGIIGRYGTLNPTDGGDTGRFSLSGCWSRTDETGITRASPRPCGRPWRAGSESWDRLELAEYRDQASIIRPCRCARSRGRMRR